MISTYLDILSLEVHHLLRKEPRGIHRTHHSLALLDDPIVLAHTEIILSKPWGLVNHTCTTLSRHIGVTAGERGRNT